MSASSSSAHPSITQPRPGPRPLRRRPAPSPGLRWNPPHLHGSSPHRMGEHSQRFYAQRNPPVLTRPCPSTSPPGPPAFRAPPWAPAPPASRSQVLAGTVINRNTGTGFDYFTLNARLSRSFRFNERFHLETIAEAFNTFNHRNNLIPNGTFAGAYPTALSTTFGQPTAIGDPRQIQLALRLIF